MKETQELIFRKLRAEEIECRVGSSSQKGLTLLLYMTSRAVVNLLTEAVGSKNWQIEQKDIAGKLYSGISIWDEDKQCWVYKWSVGKESNMEAAKGEDSDGLKRSAFRWGIGQELYTAPFIYIPAAKCNMEERNGRWTTRDQFAVEKIAYGEDGKIAGLSIVNTGSIFENKKERVFTMLPPDAKDARSQAVISNLKGK